MKGIVNVLCRAKGEKVKGAASMTYEDERKAFREGRKQVRKTNMVGALGKGGSGMGRGTRRRWVKREGKFH